MAQDLQKQANIFYKINLYSTYNLHNIYKIFEKRINIPHSATFNLNQKVPEVTKHIFS